MKERGNRWERSGVFGGKNELLGYHLNVDIGKRPERRERRAEMRGRLCCLRTLAG